MPHPAKSKPLKLDLGTGKGNNKPEGFLGVDINAAKGVDLVFDLRKRWPWKANSVDEVNCNYLIQYFNGQERVHFANELYRVLKPDATAVVITPYWCAHKAYQDIRVQWPPVAEGWFQMLSKACRDAQNFVDTSGYSCNFEYTLGYGMHPAIQVRNQDYQQNALMWSKEAAQDLVATLTRSK